MAPLPEETISSHGANNHRVDRILFRLTHSARVLFGLILFANGLNWWWKILPYPSMHDHANHALPHTPPFVQAMLDTGFMFDFVRVVEVTAVSWYLGSRCFLDCVKSARQCHGMGSFFLERVSSSVVLRPLCSHADSNGGSRTFLAWAQTAIAGMKLTVIVFGVIANLLGATAVIWLSVLMVQTFTGT
jgi:hypothetical protein